MLNEAPEPLNLLIAYPYFKDDLFNYLTKEVPRKNYRLIVDSGAFTAWNTGRKIELDDYCRFLDKISELRPFNAVQLDVFGDPEKSYKNFLIMKSRGYDVMPVFTRGETLDRLEEYYAQTDYIMFGGIVIGGKNREYVKWFLEKNKKRKCHWLGFVDMPFIKAYKPESVDSSSWMGAARFGNMALYDGSGEIFQVSKKDFSKYPTERVIEAFRRVGIEYCEFKHLRKECTWSKPWKFTGKEWSTAVPGIAQFVCTISNIVRNYEVEQKIGTKIYLAAASYIMTKTIFDGQELLLNRKILK